MSARLATEMIQKKRPDFTPKVGLILGSGLREIAYTLEDALDIPYADLPGFPEVTVKGHEGILTLGYFQKQPIVCLQGRSHAYEGKGYDSVLTYIRTLKLLGCESLIITNASGAMHADMPPGSLMLITDHINMQGSNPLVGQNDETFGPRFYPLDNAYNKDLKEKFLNAAATFNFPLREGVYICVTGPNFESAAEIRAFKALGADVVGMSTVPEVLVAQHCGLKVAAIATITNFATGLSTTPHSHDDVLKVAKKSAEQLTQLLRTVLPTL